MALARKKITARPPRERESGIRLVASRGHDSEDMRAIAHAVASAAAGFDVCARRARTKDVATRMSTLVDEARAVVDALSALVPSGVRKPTTSERLRWEWLASTAALLDGGAEGRIADEANRHLASAAALARELGADADEVRDLLVRVEALAASGRAVALAARGPRGSGGLAASA